MMVVLGLPLRFISKIRSLYLVMFEIASIALGDSRKPIPPIDAFMALFHADDVISV